VLQLPTAPLHTLATFLPNTEASDLHMLAVAEQHRARESEEKARLAVSAQEVIARLTQDLARLSPASLHQLAKRAPAAPYVPRLQEEITPLMLAEQHPRIGCTRGIMLWTHALSST